MKCRRGIGVAMLGILTATALAEPLSLGSAAPKLQVTKWVKGAPFEIESGEGKPVTIVEFWATWCGPCLTSIPHLSKMRDRHKDKGVRVVGVTAADEGNTLEKVEQFVTRMGDKMDYAVAFDGDGATYKAYMDAFEQQGIPTAFLVDRSGTVVWIGHPEFGLDEALGEVVAGTYDLEAAKKIAVLDRKADVASAFGEWADAIKAIDEILAIKPKNIDRRLNKFMLLSQQLEDHAEAKKCLAEAFAVLANDPEKTADVAMMILSDQDEHGYNPIAAAAVEKAMELTPSNPDLSIAYVQLLVATGKKEEATPAAAKAIELAKGDATRLSRLAGLLSMPIVADTCGDTAVRAIDLAIEAAPTEFQHLATKFFILHEVKKDMKAANEVGRLLIAKASADADFLNGFSWNLLTDELTKGKYNELALAAAEAMFKAPGGDGWSHLDTLAAAKFENGSVDEAIAIQKQAIEKCDNRGAKAALADNLEKYEKAKPE